MSRRGGGERRARPFPRLFSLSSAETVTSREAFMPNWEQLGLLALTTQRPLTNARSILPFDTPIMRSIAFKNVFLALSDVLHGI